MNEVLYLLCRHCVGIEDGWRPFPSTVLAREAGLTIGQTRYRLRKLKGEGLVAATYEAASADEDEWYCMHGYTVTAKAKSTEEYRKAYEEERGLCKKVWGIDIGPLVCNESEVVNG